MPLTKKAPLIRGLDLTTPNEHIKNLDKQTKFRTGLVSEWLPKDYSKKNSSSSKNRISTTPVEVPSTSTPNVPGTPKSNASQPKLPFKTNNMTYKIDWENARPTYIVSVTNNAGMTRDVKCRAKASEKPSSNN